MLDKITFNEKFPFGIQKEYIFSNGYGASVICHKGSYGHDQGLWELAILAPDGSLCYDTDITSDVVGYLTDEEVNSYLKRIEEL